MSILTWTRKPPESPGRYWYWDQRHADPDIVKVLYAHEFYLDFITLDKDPDELVAIVSYCNCDCGEDCCDPGARTASKPFSYILWAGPIPEPKEIV